MVAQIAKDGKKIFEQRKKAKKIGYFIYLLICLTGIFGYLYLRWYITVAAIALLVLFSFAYSIYQTKRLEKATGLSIQEQDYCYRMYKGIFEDKDS